MEGQSTPAERSSRSSQSHGQARCVAIAAVGRLPDLGPQLGHNERLIVVLRGHQRSREMAPHQHVRELDTGQPATSVSFPS